MIRYIALLALPLLFLAVALLLLTLPTPASDPPDPGSDTDPAQPVRTVLHNVRLLRDGGLSAPQSLLIEDGIITAIGEVNTDVDPDGAGDTQKSATLTIVDGAGGTALPGLIDSHTHSYGSSRNDALRFGVTTVLDMFTDRSLLSEARRVRGERAPTDNADMFSAGMLATAPRGHGTQYGVAVDPLTDPAQALDWVRARKAEGSDYIKLAYIPNVDSLPSITLATASAVIRAAHAEGLMAVAHISTQSAALEMIREDVDGLVHVFADELASDELIQLAVERDVFVVPTLAVIESVDGAAAAAPRDELALSAMQQQSLAASFGGEIPGFELEIALENVRRLHEAGVTILAGSDAPNPGTAHGLSLHRELQLLVRAGLDEQAVLDAATRLPAERFALEGRGRIQVGARADLIVIEGNPLHEVNSTLALQNIIKNGFIVNRSLDDSASTKASSKVLEVALLGDFEQGLQAPTGFGWTSTDDSMANGQSQASVSAVTEPTNALEIVSTVRSGFPFPWAGGAIMSSSGHDLSHYRALSFATRGTPGSYRLMAFNEGLVGIPPTTGFVVTEDWQTVTVALSDLVGANWRNFSGFAWVAGPQPGASTIYLDNVRLVK